jgi:hypothetical protein
MRHIGNTEEQHSTNSLSLQVREGYESSCFIRLQRPSSPLVASNPCNLSRMPQQSSQALPCHVTCSSAHSTGFQSKLTSTTRPCCLPTEQQEELPLPTFRLCSNTSSQSEHSVPPPLVSWPSHPYKRSAPTQTSQSSSLSWHPNGGTSFPLMLGQQSPFIEEKCTYWDCELWLSHPAFLR